MTFKEKIYSGCVQLIRNKIGLLQNALADLKQSASNETKSTAGDKHETALAMLQIEQENINKQLTDALAQKLVLVKIDPAVRPVKIVNGSLVKTNKGYFFLSVALGKIVADEVTVIALSPQSPLGIKLMGLKENDSVIMNGTSYIIESIE
ncbi:MAG: hypothetical protein JWQ40_1995 [Segetibacter sp.]|jgi:hypothetical protein|nr:hypothetical protein [Segetibacter sp.]